MPEVRLFGSLRLRARSDRATLPGTTVREVLVTLCDGDPGLCDVILKDGYLMPFVRITVNGHDIMLADGLETPVSESDSLAIFPPIAGG